MDVRSRITGRRGVGLPFTDSCPPLGENTQDLWSRAITAGEKLGWGSLELRGLSRRGAEAQRNASATYHGHTLDLTRHADDAELFNAFHSATRRGIRKAEKHGITVEHRTDAEAIELYYALHCRTRKKHGLPPQPFLFFRKIHEHILSAGHGFVTLGIHEGNPIAGAVYFTWNEKQALYKFGASDERHLSLRANNLVMWRSIQRLREAGYETLDFGRTSRGNEGLRRFKLGWGTEEHAIQYQRYDLRARQFVGDYGKENETGWHNAVFRLLPLPCLKLAGRVLYRHMG